MWKPSILFYLKIPPSVFCLCLLPLSFTFSLRPSVFSLYLLPSAFFILLLKHFLNLELLNLAAGRHRIFVHELPVFRDLVTRDFPLAEFDEFLRRGLIPVFQMDGREDLLAEQTTYRVLRGGSWNSDSVDLRTAARIYFDPLFTTSDFGFRCAMDVDE